MRRDILRRSAIFLAWLAWIMLVTVVVIVMDGLLRPCDIPPRSTIFRLLGGYDGQVISPMGDISLLAWAWESVLPAHLVAYAMWRAFKATFLP
jgi:hypothetical protein